MDLRHTGAAYTTVAYSKQRYTAAVVIVVVAVFMRMTPAAQWQDACSDRRAAAVATDSSARRPPSTVSFTRYRSGRKYKDRLDTTITINNAKTKRSLAIFTPGAPRENVQHYGGPR